MEAAGHREGEWHRRQDMKPKLLACAAAVMLVAIDAAQGEARGTYVPATVENSTRAESDMYGANLAREGGLGKLSHRREPASIDKQDVIRLNRDTLYTSGVFDLDAGPVTIT